MTQTPAEILLHPVRLRIVLTFGTEELTTAQIAERLPDVAQATLYRQVATLVDAGMLEVVSERRVRGGVERTYARVPDAVRIGPDDGAPLDHDQLMGGFVVFAGALIESAEAYLGDPSADPSVDAFSFRQAALWLDDDERSELIEGLRAAISPYLENEPAASRERLLLNTILVPDRAAKPAGSDEDDD